MSKEKSGHLLSKRATRKVPIEWRLFFFVSTSFSIRLTGPDHDRLVPAQRSWTFGHERQQCKKYIYIYFLINLFIIIFLNFRRGGCWHIQKRLAAQKAKLHVHWRCSHWEFELSHCATMGRYGRHSAECSRFRFPKLWRGDVTASHVAWRNDVTLHDQQERPIAIFLHVFPNVAQRLFSFSLWIPNTTCCFPLWILRHTTLRLWLTEQCWRSLCTEGLNSRDTTKYVTSRQNVPVTSRCQYPDVK